MPPLLPPLLLAQSLCKSYDGHRVVEDVSLQVSAGEVVGFLGPNGAGKTTTMRMIAGFLSPDSGTVEIQGYRMTPNHSHNHKSSAKHGRIQGRIQAQAALGYLPEGAPLWPDMEVAAFLRFMGTARGLRGSALEDGLKRVEDLLGLHKARRQPMGVLSKGYRRRVGLAAALIHDPDVLVLDEPTDGLDPNQKQGVRDLIKNLSETRAILISTHILEEVEALCSRIVVLSGGKIVANGSLADILAHDPKASPNVDEESGAKPLERAFQHLTQSEETLLQAGAGIGGGISP